MLLSENVIVKIIVRSRISRGRDRGVGDFSSAIRLIGRVKAQIHKVSVIRGGDIWSRVII